MNGEASVVLRPVTVDDRDLLLAWARDPVTRSASFHPGDIDGATHAAWLDRRLADAGGRIWIGVVDGRPIGQVRVDRDADARGEVGISVAPEARGRGLAGPLLRAGMERARTELGVTEFVALVRPENAVSLRLFGSAGFVDVGAGERAGVACRVLVRRSDRTP